VTIPSVAGKTINPNNYLDLRFWLSAGSSFDARTGNLGQQAITFDLWGVQLEAGSSATPFRRNGVNIADELASCQRYYIRFGANDTSNYGLLINNAFAQNSSTMTSAVVFPVQMRVTPTSIESSLISFRNFAQTYYAVSSPTWDTSVGTPTGGAVYGGISGATAGHTGFIGKNNNAAGFIAFNAEL
jgi:hypothetical protein